MASAGGSCYTPAMRARTLLTGARAALAAALVLAAAPAMAQSRSIYGGGVDADAALVRLVDAGAPGEVELWLGAETLKAGALGEATPYRAVVADVYMLGYLGKRYEFMPEPGSLYTVAATAGGLVVLEDERHDDPARAQLYFYNLGAAPAELRTADGSVLVAGPCAPGGSAQVAVNPVQVGLAAYSGGAKAGEPLRLRLERGASYSVFVYPGSSGPAAFSVKAALE